MTDIKIPENVKAIMQKLEANNYDAYIIGGAVRDTLLGVEPKDWDVFTNANGETLLTLFPHGKILGGEERQKKILTVIVDGVEVSQYRRSGDRLEVGSTLEEHLATCDFTINALAVGLDGELVDLHGGRDDLHSKYVVCVGKPQDRIKEDGLRVLRAIRFLSKLGGNFILNAIPEEELERIIIFYDISQLPVERVRDELLKIISYELGAVHLREYKMLKKIIPEFKDCEIDGGPHHDELVSAHGLNACYVANSLTSNPLLKFACLCHDIGKGKTVEFSAGYARFARHDTEGAKLMKERMEALKFSTDDIKYVTTLIANHMAYYKYDETAKKSWVKLFQRLEDGGVPIEDFAVLQYCDSQANTKNPRQTFLEFIKERGQIRKYYEMKFAKEPFRVSDLEINGHDVMKLGVEAGPEVGKVLKEVFDKVCDAELKNDRHELLNYLSNKEE